MITLSTVEEAISHLNLLVNGSQNADTDVVFGGQLEFIRFKFDGKDFNHSIPGDLAKGLAIYQEEIYRAAKFALFGGSSRTQLSYEQRKSFELIFEVDQGSTDVLAPVGVIAGGLAAGVAGMTSTTLAVVIILVVLILAASYVAVNIKEGIETTKQKKIDEDSKNQLASSVANMATAMTDSNRQAIQAVVHQSQFSIAKKFEDAQENGVKEVLKSVPQAEEVVVNGVKFDSDEIKEIRRRAKRSKSEYEELTVSCNVYADTYQHPTRLTLTSPELPSEVKADWPDDVDEGKEAMLWDAIKNKERIFLVAGVTIINGKAKSGVIIDVVSPDEISANA